MGVMCGMLEFIDLQNHSVCRPCGFGPHALGAETGNVDKAFISITQETTLLLIK